ncbi:condensation domain-containing protein [Streptomyces hirsutus]|uniref:condensation domain-containing protein n=1 Tax=Streptomyces hirsutus TaxID=35620 RepID=UPI003867FE27|nr:condensation domain-containing protein [Streptomyces hirsutus]
MTRPRTVADRLSRLTPQQRAFLQSRLKGAGAAPQEPPLTCRTGDRSVSRLGLDQERIWILDQLDPGRHTYNISTGMRFTGAFDEQAFQDAVTALVRRHELLRSSVEVRDDIPVLRVHDQVDTPVHVLDLRFDPGRADETVRNLVRRPFDLASGGPLRVLVVRTADDEYRVVETMHHSATDQWSYVRLNRELLEHYRAARENRPARVPDLPVQYGDFATWQRQCFTGVLRERHRDFWRGYLDGAPDRLPLPYDASPHGAGHDGKHHYFRLDDRLGAAFLDLCRRLRVTLSDALLAVYVALLHEETGQHDIVVGLPSATRGRPETHDLVGFLLTNVPLRARLPHDPAPAQILDAVRQASAEVADHREVPFSEIVEAVSPERSLDHYPLLQTMHLVLDFDDTVVQVPDAEVVGTEVEDGVSPMDITVGWWRAGNHMYGRFEYRTDLFTSATIERLARRLLDLVRVFVEHPDQPLQSRPAPRTADTTTASAPPVAALPEPDPDELRRITDVWREVLDDAHIGPDDNFFRVGGTSLGAVRLAHALRRAGFALTPRHVFRAPTIRGQLALARRDTTPATLGTRETGAVSPEQEDLLEGGLRRPELWTHSLVLAADRDLDPEWLKVATRRVVAAHPGLCSTFRRTDTGWHTAPSDHWLWCVETPDADPAEVAAAHRRAFGLGRGPLFAASLIPDGTIVLTAHHLVVDGLSWQILVDDLNQAYGGARPPTEPRHPSAYAAARPDPRRQLPYWRSVLEGARPLTCRTGRPDLIGGEAAHQVRVALPPGRQAPDWSTEALTAVAEATEPWFGGGDVVLDLIAPGRDLSPATGFDPARAVGFHATVHPVRLPAGGEGEQRLRRVGDALDTVPDGGRGHLALRWSDDPETRRTAAAWPRAQLSFNYLGTLLGSPPGTAASRPLLTVREQIGPIGNDEAPRYHHVAVLFEANGEQAVFTWKYNPDAVDEAAVKAAAATAGEAFTRLARRNSGGTPSIAGMSLQEVNRMLTELTRERENRTT